MILTETIDRFHKHGAFEQGDIAEVNKEIRKIYNKHLLKKGIDITWMTVPCDIINSKEFIAVSYKADDLDKSFMDLYKELGEDFHPYMFSKLEYLDIPEGREYNDLSEEEIEGLGKKSTYIIRYGRETK